MSQTTISIRMDTDLKKALELVCNDLGITISTAVTILAKKMIWEQRIPFEVSVDPFYSEANMRYLKKAAAALDAGEGVEHSLIED